MSADLLQRIHAFRVQFDLPPSICGKVLCGNSDLIKRLEAGGSVTLKTAAKIEAVMAERRAAKSEHAA